MAETRSLGLTNALDEAPISRFHLRAVLVSGMGFFTDAYDLFVIGIAATLIRQQWHLDSGQLALLNAAMLAAAVAGASVLGRVADLVGRKRVYWLVAAIMIAGALGSAVSPTFWVLIVFRLVLGFGVGGDYPVSAVLMSEYANRRDRGKLVGMVFSTQALGLIVGPLIALALLGGGVSDERRGGSSSAWVRSRPPPWSTCAARCLSHPATRLRSRAATGRRSSACPSSARVRWWRSLGQPSGTGWACARSSPTAGGW